MRNSIFSIPFLVTALAASPALADEAVDSVAGFDLADVSGSVSLLQSTKVELPSPSFGALKEETVAESNNESTSPLSGGVDVLSDYMLDDGIRPTKGWVVQPWFSVTITEGLSFNAWASKGLETDVGDEIDLGFTYERSLGGGVTGRLVANHYVLFGNVPDMQEITVGAKKDGFDLSASYYPWAGGMQDGFRTTAKYDFAITPKLAASVGVVYETGMEADDTFVALAGLSYDLGRGFSAKVNAYLPHKEDGVHERRVVFGIGWSF